MENQETQNPKDTIQELKKQKEEAVYDNDFSLAAELRDKIDKIEKDRVQARIKEQIEELLANENITLGAIIFTTKDSPEPQIMRKGHFYDTAAMLHHVLSAYRAKASVELGF